MILGLVMFYTWIHSVVVVFKKTKDLTSYETVVLIAGFSFALLYFMGTM